MYRFTVTKATNGFKLQVASEIMNDKGVVMRDEIKEYVFNKSSQLNKALKTAVSELEIRTENYNDDDIPF